MSRKLLLVSYDEENSRTYFQALQDLGVSSEDFLEVTGSTPADAAAEAAHQASALVLAGGPDVHPRYYDQEPLENANLEIDEGLDRAEFAVLSVAEEREIPTWAICRGMQSINIHLGGTLYQDLPLQLDDVRPHYIREPLDRLVHTLEVRDHEHPMAQPLLQDPEMVNTRHHQAVDALAPRLTPIAWSPDGVLEVAATRPDDPWWARCVQWHPEDLLAYEAQRQLWLDFLRSADIDPTTPTEP